MEALSNFMLGWVAGFEKSWAKHKEQLNFKVQVPD
jgi:hypothetical protein